jgi:dipeptidyl aminopeptidase/acylaminoacyl peptidase
VLRRASDGATVREFAVEHILSFQTSPPAISADGARIAYSVNEIGNDEERHDRTYLFSVDGGPAGYIEGVQDPVWIAGTGELLVREGEDGLRLFSATLADMGPLPVRVDQGKAVAAASADGRYIAHERDSQIWVYDRTSGQSWQATRTAVWGKQQPVFSPDGRWLAMLGRGTFDVLIVHVIPFVPGVLTEVTAADVLENEFGQSIDGSDRMAWIPG